MLVAYEFFDALPIRILQVIQVFPIFQMTLVLINIETRDSLVRGFGGHKYRRNWRAKVNLDETTAPPLSFRHVLKPRPPKIAYILGRSSLEFRNLPDGSSLEVSFKRITYEREVSFSN